MLILPVFQNQSADFTQRVILDDVEIILRLAWNTKSEYWMINEYKEVESGLTLNGIKVLVNYPMLYQFVKKLPGQLFVFSTDPSLGNEITYDSLGNGHDLVYITEDEFAEWVSLNGFK